MMRRVSWPAVGAGLALLLAGAVWMAYQSPAFALLLNGLVIICQ
jgi:hypothetical protein